MRAPGPAPSRDARRGGTPLRRRRVPGPLGTALGVAGAAVLMAGCGEQAIDVREANAYVARVNGVQTRFAGELERLADPIARATTTGDVRRETRRFQDGVRRARTDLQRIRPPAPLRPAHGRLIRAYTTWDAPLQRFTTALRRRDGPAILDAKSRFSTATTEATSELRAASTEINARVAELSD